MVPYDSDAMMRSRPDSSRARRAAGASAYVPRVRSRRISRRTSGSPLVRHFSITFDENFCNDISAMPPWSAATTASVRCDCLRSRIYCKASKCEVASTGHGARSRRISLRISRRLHDVIAERVDDELRRVAHDLADQVIALLRVGVIETALQDAAPANRERP